ncbi:unnamed protein product [Prunus brigantina]
MKLEAGFDEVDWLWIPRHLNHGAHVAARIDLRTVELQKLSWGGEHVAGLVFSAFASFLPGVFFSFPSTLVACFSPTTFFRLS